MCYNKNAVLCFPPQFHLLSKRSVQSDWQKKRSIVCYLGARRLHVWCGRKLYLYQYTITSQHRDITTHFRFETTFHIVDFIIIQQKYLCIYLSIFYESTSASLLSRTCYLLHTTYSCVCMAGGNRSGQQLIVYLFGNILETLVLVHVQTGRS